MAEYNNITCWIHGTADFDEMCRGFLRQTVRLIDFDAAVFCYSDNADTAEMNRAVSCGCSERAAKEYLESCRDGDMGRRLMSGGRKVYRGSDIHFAQDQTEAVYCRHLFREEGYRFSAHLLPETDERVLAQVALFRRDGKPDFLSDELFVLDMLREHLSLRLRHFYETEQHRHNKLSVEECREKFRLTNRETTILGLLIQGKPNEEICSGLSITNNTLKKHILNIYRKMSIRNRTQLFKLVREYAD